MQLAQTYRNLDPALRRPISAVIGLALAAGTLAGIWATLEQIFAGTVIASKLSTLVSWITGTISAATGLAVAAGTLIGVLGVWALQVTGVMDAVKNLGKLLGGTVSPTVRDFGLTMASVLTLGLFPLIAALGAFINGTLQGGFQQGISDAIRVLDTFTFAFRNVREQGTKLLDAAIDRIVARTKTRMERLASIADQWGIDFISNFIRGLESKLPDLEASVRGALELIEGISFDKESNDRMARRWGSDLVQEFAGGMQNEQSTLQNAIPDPGQDTGLAPTAGPASGSSPGGGTQINVTLEAGAVQIGRGGGGGSVDEGRVEPNDIAEETANEFERRIGGQGAGL